MYWRMRSELECRYYVSAPDCEHGQPRNHPNGSARSLEMVFCSFMPLSLCHRPLCYIPVLIHRITTAPLRETIRRPTCHLRPSHRAPASRPLLLVLEPVLYPSRLFKMCIIRLATLQILIIKIIVTITTIITKRASLQRPELALEVVETQLAEGWP